MSIGKIAVLAVSGQHQLALTWDDGMKAQIDLATVIASLEALASIADPRDFAEATLSADGWSVEWPSGIDFGSPQLRRWADEQAGRSMAASDFRHWMDKHGFSLDRASEALGVSRRMIAYYLSGEQSIPKTVMLATEGVDHRMAA